MTTPTDPDYRDAVEQAFYEYHGWKRRAYPDWMHVWLFFLGLAGGIMLGLTFAWMGA